MLESSNVIWSVRLRLIHWIIAIVVLLDALVLTEGDAPHQYLGYLAAALVIIRTFLGIAGHGYERFSRMPLALSEIVKFLRHHFSGKSHYQGHNPLASLVYILMWVLILGLAITGWMMGLDAYWGDEDLERAHILLSDSLIVLALLHVAGILVDALIYKRKTWMGMIDGRGK